jgi:hypothetical protein
MATDPPVLEQHHCDAGTNLVRIAYSVPMYYRAVYGPTGIDLRLTRELSTLRLMCVLTASRHILVR